MNEIFLKSKNDSFTKTVVYYKNNLKTDITFSKHSYDMMGLVLCHGAINRCPIPSDHFCFNHKKYDTLHKNVSSL